MLRGKKWKELLFPVCPPPPHLSDCTRKTLRLLLALGRAKRTRCKLQYDGDDERKEWWKSIFAVHSFPLRFSWGKDEKHTISTLRATQSPLFPRNQRRGRIIVITLQISASFCEFMNYLLVENKIAKNVSSWRGIKPNQRRRDTPIN